MSADAPAPGPTSKENEFSLEDLDKIIEAEDPNFKIEMEGLKAAGLDIQANIELLSVDGEEGLEKEEPQKDDKTKDHLSPVEKVIAKIKRMRAGVKTYVKLRALALYVGAVALGKKSLDYSRHELPERLKYHATRVAGVIRGAATFLGGHWQRFSGLSRIQKVAIGFALVAGLTSAYLLARTFTGASLPRFVDPLPRSLANEAAWVKSYATKNEMQNLFHAFPEVEFYVLLTKVIVNLRADANSGINPMGIFEMYLGLDSQDTAIEVKDREREIMDIIQRTMEKFNYSDAVSQVGKMRIKVAIRDAVNEALNQGVVFHVYFNTFITNP